MALILLNRSVMQQGNIALRKGTSVTSVFNKDYKFGRDKIEKILQQM